MTPAPITVAIVDDQALIRTGLRTMLSHDPGIEIVGEADDGEKAVLLVRRHRPDVVLMDLRMPVLDGIAATRAITADPSLAAVRVVILTTFDLDDYVYAAIRAGASGFLLKDARPEDILAAVRVVAAGDALLAPGVTRRLIEEFARRPEVASIPGPGLATLTERERGPCPRRTGPLQRRDRRTALREPGDGQDPRQPHHDQDRRPGQGPARRPRLRERPGAPGSLNQHLVRCTGGTLGQMRSATIRRLSLVAALVLLAPMWGRPSAVLPVVEASRSLLVGLAPGDADSVPAIRREAPGVRWLTARADHRRSTMALAVVALLVMLRRGLWERVLTIRSAFPSLGRRRYAITLRAPPGALTVPSY